VIDLPRVIYVFSESENSGDGKERALAEGEIIMG